MTITPYMPVYRRADVTMVRGEGCYLFDESGKKYLDCAAGIAVNALGHGHPQVVAALKEQADTLWHCSNNYKNDQLLRFAERLTKASDFASAFFCSTGTEAVEAGIKFIRRYHHAKGNTQRHRIITFEGGFHGRSITCISAGGNDIAREGFAPLLGGFDRARLNHLDSVRSALSPKTAGILIEPVQGEGGVNVATSEFLQGLRQLCDEHDLILMFDEVQCGYGRSGALFMHELCGVRPDMVSVAKGIGNGFPLGACLAVEKIVRSLTPGCHGSTYGSNPLAMAVGNAVLDVMQQPNFFDHVKARGAQLLSGLQAVATKHPALIAEVRGQGLIIGVQMKVPARPISDTLREAGLLVAPAYGDVLRFVPPLIISEAEVNKAVQLFAETLSLGKG